MDKGEKISALRLWVFRLSGIILVPALVLVLAEAGLRVAGYGYPSGFLLKCVAAGRSAFAENNRFTWTFFPRRIARTPVSFSFPAVKPPQTYRIFVLGESAAQGDPEPSYGFSRILGVMLEERYPGVNFEIVNTAVTAINSHVVLRIARDVAPRDGDLFIAYMGNNEVVGPYGPGTVFSPVSSRLSLIRAGIALKSTRVGQLLGWLARCAEGGSAPKKWLGMEMFLGKQVRAEDPRMSKVYEYFRRNLKDIIRVAGRHGIKVIVSTVGTNLRDCAPFASMHRAGLDAAQKREWDALYHEGVGRQGAGDISGALKSYRAAARIDPQYAALDYRMGQCYEAAGDYVAARKSYVGARDYDTLRFRADSRINAIIRQVAGPSTSGPTSGLYLVDAARFFEEASPGGIPGDNIFYEHVHMNFHGNYLLAEVMLRQIGRILPNWIKNKEGAGVLSEEQCEKRLAFTGYDHRRVYKDVAGRLRQPPFTNRLDNARELARYQQAVAALGKYASAAGMQEAAEEYRQALEVSSAGGPGSDPWLHYNYAVLLSEEKNYAEAAVQFQAALRQLPEYYLAHEKLAEALAKLGDFKGAVAECGKALRIIPDYYSADYTLAFALGELGRFDESIRVYRGLLKTQPEMSMGIYNEIGRVFVRQGKYREAADSFKSALRAGGNEAPDVHYNLGYALKKLGRQDRASGEFDQAIKGYLIEVKGNPGSAADEAALGNAYAEKGDFQSASARFRRAVELDPTDLNSRYGLIKSLEAAGWCEEAIEAARKAADALSGAGDMDAARGLRAYMESMEAKKAAKF